MKKTVLYSILGIALFGGLLWTIITWQGGNIYISRNQDNTPIISTDQKIYVANEGDSTVSVIDAVEKRLIKNIHLSEQYYGKFLKYSAHNVQVSPRGSIVAVTANIFEDGDSHEAEMTNSDEVILIDPNTDTIIGRIPMGIGTHLAHIVIDSTDTYAYLASQEKGIIFVVDLASRKILKEVKLPDKSEPHGIRLSPDGKSLYIAMIGEKAIAILDTDTNTIELIPVGDRAIQVATSPDGKYVFASLYMTKRIARYDTVNKKLDIISLPNGAKGPVQIYPTPDSRFLYVADQGFYFDQPTSNQIYKINIETKQIITSYTGGEGPHGIVVSPDGKMVYVSNLLSGNVSVIDTTLDMIVATIPAGKKSNGISIWTRGIGGTP